jgi:hypothetical protein
MKFTHLQGKLGPTHLEALRQAYDAACAHLKIGPDDPLAASVAAKIIALSSDGESDPKTLARLCIESVKLPRRKFRRRKGSTP